MSEVKVNKISPRSSTTINVGDSGDTLALATDAVTGFNVGSDAAGDILYNDGTDYTRLAKPGTPADEVLTFATGASAPSWAAAAAGGKVLQVVQTVKTDTASTTATLGSLVDMTGMSVAITPSATTSKVLVFWNITVGCIANTGINIRLLRDAATPLLGDAASNRTRVTALVSSSNANILLTGSGMYLDSPSSTSSTTYKLQWSADWVTTIYLNRSNNDTDATNYARTTSTITAMEIGA